MFQRGTLCHNHENTARLGISVAIYLVGSILAVHLRSPMREPSAIHSKEMPKPTRICTDCASWELIATAIQMKQPLRISIASVVWRAPLNADCVFAIDGSLRERCEKLCETDRAAGDNLIINAIREMEERCRPLLNVSGRLFRYISGTSSHRVELRWFACDDAMAFKEAAEWVDMRADHSDANACECRDNEVKAETEHHRGDHIS